MSALQSERTFIIAEMANAHEGKPDVARQIIQAAAQAGADAIKFQVFTADELATPDFHAYAMYQKLDQPRDVWAELVAYAHELGIEVYAEVFGLDSAATMISLGIDGFKIHAADVGNAALLRVLGATGKPIVLSTGGSTWIETSEAVSVLRASGAGSILLMFGFQSFPTKLEHSFLRRIATLREKFNLPVGFASHVAGDTPEAVELPLWAVAAGAEAIECHITMDRGPKGFDYFSSLEPHEFATLVKRVREAHPAYGDAAMRMPADEITYRNNHKKQLVATRNIAMGEMLTTDNVALKRIPNVPPGRPLGLEYALGRRVAQPISVDAPIQMKDLQLKVAATLACRLESTRLYGKPMQLIGDQPIIQHLIDRLRHVSLIDEIVLAISDGPGRNVFIDYAEKHGLPYIIGPEKDVLKRLIMAGDRVQADIILRITTENPYAYWEGMDDLVRQHIDANADLTAPEKLPLGSVIEVVTLEALKKAHTHGEDRHRSELCTLFLVENPDIFTIQRIAPPEKLQRPDIRLTVDTPQDLILVRTIFERLHAEGNLISIEQIVDLFDQHPELADINSGEQTLYLWK